MVKNFKTSLLYTLVMVLGCIAPPPLWEALKLTLLRVL